MCLCNEEVIDQLIRPLKTIMQVNSSKQQKTTSGGHILSSVSASSVSGGLGATVDNSINLYDESCMHIVANVLSKLASTECGYFQLLYNDSRKSFQPGFNM